MPLRGDNRLLGRLPEQLIECESPAVLYEPHAPTYERHALGFQALALLGVGLTAARKRDATLRIDDPVPG